MNSHSHLLSAIHLGTSLVRWEQVVSTCHRDGEPVEIVALERERGSLPPLLANVAQQKPCNTLPVLAVRLRHSGAEKDAAIGGVPRL